MVGEASGRMQKADCRDEIALPAAMLAWLKCGKQRTRNSRKRFLVFFCSLFVKARVVYRLRWVKALNVYLVRVIYDSVEDSISQRAVCTSELIVPVGLMILGTEDG